VYKLTSVVGVEAVEGDGEGQPAPVEHDADQLEHTEAASMVETALDDEEIQQLEQHHELSDVIVEDEERQREDDAEVP